MIKQKDNQMTKEEEQQRFLELSALFNKNDAIKHIILLEQKIADYESSRVELPVKPANGGRLSIKIYRDDNLEGFAAYHAQDESETKTILMNVYATFAASVENNIDVKEFIIQNLMHEFGHALEEYYQKEFDEDFIEKAVQSYFDKYRPDSRLSV